VVVGLRLWGLTFQSYWFDELFSADYSNPANSALTVVKLTLADVHPPFYQLLMWLSYQLFGYTEWAGRFPSALAGVLTIPVIYLLGRDLFSSRVGLYAAALAAPNFYLLNYAQEARSYALLYFLCSLSFLYFMRTLESRSRFNLACYIAATITLLYTHYFGFVLLFAQGLIACVYLYTTGWSNRPLLTRAAIAAGVIAVAIAPLVPVIAGHSAINDFWIPQPAADFLLKYFQAYFSSVFVAGVVLLLLCISAGGLFIQSVASRARFGLIALLIWIVVGYLLPWLRGFIGQPVMTDRNTIMLVPPILLLAGYGLQLIPKIWLQRSVGAVLLAYSFYYLFFSFDYYGQVRKNQYREITHAMDAFEPRLPVYTLSHNEKKYNVYFTQLNSSLVAQDASRLNALRAEGTAPPLFWLAGGLVWSPKAEIGKQFGLTEVGRYTYKGTAAAMLVNPEAATSLALAESLHESDADQVVYTSTLLPASDVSLQLLLAVNELSRSEFAGVMKIELLAADGRIAYSESTNSGRVPAILLLEPEQGSVRLKVTLPAGEQAPSAWLMPVGVE
jgi:mannosyltransferase